MLGFVVRPHDGYNTHHCEAEEMSLVEFANFSVFHWHPYFWAAYFKSSVLKNPESMAKPCHSGASALVSFDCNLGVSRGRLCFREYGWCPERLALLVDRLRN